VRCVICRYVGDHLPRTPLWQAHTAIGVSGRSQLLLATSTKIPLGVLVVVGWKNRGMENSEVRVFNTQPAHTAEPYGSAPNYDRFSLWCTGFITSSIVPAC
jgi:hypothetical protein